MTDGTTRRYNDGEVLRCSAPEAVDTGGKVRIVEET